MLKAALQDERPALVFDDLHQTAWCAFCGRLRPAELLVTWMCSRCKQKPLLELLQLVWKMRRERA